MVTIKRWTFCKILAVLICLIIAAEAHIALAYQNPADPLDTNFQAARTAYFAQKYEDAKVILEKLIADLDAIEGRDTFKGAVYVLAGANYEKLDFKELAVKYYCRAKDVVYSELFLIDGCQILHRNESIHPAGQFRRRGRN